MKIKFSHLMNIALVILMTGILFACKGSSDKIDQPKERFMVTFSKNINNVTVNNMPEPQNLEEGSLVTKPATNPSSQLYNFIGWFKDQDGQIPFNFETERVTRRMTIYAGWSLKVTTFNVSFDLNYENAPLIDSVEVVKGHQVDAPNKPSRDGFEFIGWSTRADANFHFNFETAINDNLELFAIWERIYQVTYKYNLDGVKDDREEYLESENTIRPADPFRENFSFGGWYTNLELTSQFTFGGKLDGNVSLYAKWIRTSYSVTFDFNDPDVEFNKILKANVNSDVPAPAEPVRDGYIFAGWHTVKTNQSDDTLFDFKPVTDDNTILYARWIKLYKITFDLNYDDAPLLNPQIIQEGNEASTITPIRDGFLFGGWYEDSGVSLEYEFGPVSNDLTIYAKWIDESELETRYTVTFDLNYEGSTPIIQSVLAGSATHRPEDPVREGFIFDKWVTAPTGQSQYRFGAVNEDIIVYARWVNVWKVSFNFNYDNSPETVEYNVIDGNRLNRPSDPMRPGLWNFVTWVDANDNPFIFTTVIKQNYELFAKWTESGFVVTWDFNFEAAPAPVSNDVLLGTLAREPEKPERPGNWAIIGWYLDKNLTKPFSINSEITDNITLYAKWAEGYAYRIDLNYAGAPSIPTQLLSEGGKIPNKPNNPVRNGYTFVGWSTVPNQDPNFNAFGETITGDITIYAQWQHVYIFEAEYVDLSGKSGAGWSGGAAGTAMIVQDVEEPKANASNGFYLSYLYTPNLFIEFEITSDRDTQATLILRLSAEQANPLVLNDDEFLVEINDVKVPYGGIYIEGGFAALEAVKRPFEDFVSVTVNLTEGINVIRFTVNNQNGMGGTMAATAPLFDAIKLDTVAVLTWVPFLENLSQFN